MLKILPEYLHQLRHAAKLIFRYPKLNLEETDYDAYWESKRSGRMGEISPFQKRRADLVLADLSEGDSVLDIGCGDGAVLLYLKRNRRLQASAADISEKALAYLETQGVSTIRFDLNRPEEIPSLPEADHILLLEVLEHMQNPEAFLKRIEGKARRSVIFSFPNTGYFAYRIRLLLGRAPMQWRSHPGEHLRFWTEQDLKWWLKELGYGDRASIRIYEGLPILNRLWGGLFGMGFVIRINTIRAAPAKF